MTVKIVKLVWLVLLLIVGIGCLLSLPYKQGGNDLNKIAIFINPALTIEPYLATEASLGELTPVLSKAQLSMPWGVGIEVSNSDKSLNSVITTCHDFFAAQALALAPTNSFEFTPYRSLGMLCHALNIASQLHSSQYAFMGDLSLDHLIAHTLPVDFALFISASEEQRAKNDPDLKLWADIEHIKTVENINENKALLYADGVRHEFTIMAKGDINNDKIEDILVRLISSVDGGSYVTTRVYVLTKLSVNDKIIILQTIQ